MYTPAIQWDFQYSFSNTVLHIEEALPCIFLPKLGTHLNETNLYQIPKFHKNQREFLLGHSTSIPPNRILVSEKQNSKDVFFLRKLLRNTHNCQIGFSAKISKRYFPSQKTFHGADPTGS